jgi:hypothetical protein
MRIGSGNTVLCTSRNGRTSGMVKIDIDSSPPKSNFHKSVDHPNIVPLFSNFHREQLSILVPRYSLSLYDVLRNSKLQRRTPLEASLVLIF